MAKEDIVLALKIMHTFMWLFFTSYYFWGEREVTVTDPIDESGWVPDGAFASIVVQPAEAEP